MTVAIVVRWQDKNRINAGFLGPDIDEIGLLRGIPPKNILFGNILVGFKDELDAHHEFICGMHPFD